MQLDSSPERPRNIISKSLEQYSMALEQQLCCNSSPTAAVYSWVIYRMARPASALAAGATATAAATAAAALQSLMLLIPAVVARLQVSQRHGCVGDVLGPGPATRQ